METQAILWTAEQVCGECGEGVFPYSPIVVTCSVCGHEHPQDPWNLDEGERFEWVATAKGTTLHVVAYDTTDEEEE